MGESLQMWEMMLIICVNSWEFPKSFWRPGDSFLSKFVGTLMGHGLGWPWPKWLKQPRFPEIL